MNDHEKRFYITTAIDYPNSVPHMGHAYEKVVADFYARSARIRGRDTHFLIGLDEHGQKIQEAAVAAGKSPREFVDEKAQVFRELYDLLEISNTDFIRTSEPRHHRFVQNLYERARAAGDIYKGVYQGDYCISCERALTRSELVDGKCPIHMRPTTTVEEESYFFRLGKHRDAIRTHIETHPEFVVPEQRRNEVLQRLRDEVLDLSISRSTFDWGIPLPDDPKHVLYVWFDALSNYASALAEPADLSGRFWPADCHVIGKDILWFHTVIWPAMLRSAGIELPRQVYAHGFILDKRGNKMAKHLGNVVDPLEVVREYSVDVLRFYFLRAFSSGQDGKFSLEELEERYHTELGNDLGNLLMRLSKLVEQRLGGVARPAGGALEEGARSLVREFFALVDDREHHRAVDAVWKSIRGLNAYLNDRAPWKIRDAAEAGKVLWSTLDALRVIVHLVFPVMPRTAEQAAATLGFEIGTLTDLSGDTKEPATYHVRKAPPLFPRRERAPSATTTTTAAAESPPAPAVDPFSRLEIRVGRIEAVEDHPDADSLFAMTVSLGRETRSICAGLRGHLEAHELLGRKVVVLANLKPATLRGIESRGMVLAADRADGRIVVVDPGEAPVGDLVQVAGVDTRPKKKLSIRDFEKAPLTVRSGVVEYAGKPLGTAGGGRLRADAEDGARVR